MKKILLVCIHNSARSQMAAAFVNHHFPSAFEAKSAGLEPGTLNPLAVETMGEIGIDLSHAETRGVNEILDSGESFSHVITVCDETNGERCPVFPGAGERLHWSFPDPSALTGTLDEKRHAIRRIRDAIGRRIREWCRSEARSLSPAIAEPTPSTPAARGS